jgi:Transposase
MSRDLKYIGMDVHKEAVVIAVLNSSGKLGMESIVERQASSILQFIHGLRGELHVTWEEGTWASWLYDLLQPQVAQVLVCDPRRNALLKEGNKSDKGDARKLADLLRECCARSTPENMDCGRCASWVAVIRPSAKT